MSQPQIGFGHSPLGALPHLTHSRLGGKLMRLLLCSKAFLSMLRYACHERGNGYVWSGAASHNPPRLFLLPFKRLQTCSVSAHTCM